MKLIFARNPYTSTALSSLLAALAMVTASTPTAQAATLKVTVENLAPIDGGIITPFWFGFHNGSFNTFDVGGVASSGLEIIAEEGLHGLEGSAVLDPTGIDPTETISGLFSTSDPAGTQGVVEAIPLLGVFPGQIASTVVHVDAATNRFFSYAAMFFPSNDGFIGDEEAIEIFDIAGNFMTLDFIILGSDIYDSGTEVNDEIADNIPFIPDFIGNGTSEGGTIQLHPGLMPPGSGGVVDDIFPGVPFSSAVAGGFTEPGFQFARVTISQVPEPSLILGSLVSLGGLSVLKQRRKTRV